MKILVTPRSFRSSSQKPVKMLYEKGYELMFNNIGRPYEKEEIMKLVTDIDGIIIGIDKLDADIIGKASKLKVISKYGIGVDNIDISFATQNNIVVTNTPNANANAVADLTFGLMLSLARKIPEADRKTKSGKWEKIIGKSIYGKTLGIIGLGKIGKQVVNRAQGFEMNIIVNDVLKDEKFAKNYNIKYVNLNELLQKSDYITIHIPLNDSTRNMIDWKELQQVKEGAFLINTSRGGIINENALFESLKNKILKGVALDAFTTEPLKKSPLMKLDNVILTPHIGGYTEEAIESMGLQAAQNLIDALEGKKSKNRVN